MRRLRTFLRDLLWSRPLCRTYDRGAAWGPRWGWVGDLIELVDPATPYKLPMLFMPGGRKPGPLFPRTGPG